MNIQIPSCTHPFFIHKHIHIFLNERDNTIPVEMVSYIAGGAGIVDYFSNMLTKDNNNKVSSDVEDSAKKVEDKITTNTSPIQADSNQISLKIATNHSDPIESLKGTKLYYLYQRNGQCARWV